MNQTIFAAHTCRVFGALLLVAGLTPCALGEVFQWKVNIDAGTVTKKEVTTPRTFDAYLWVPPGADRIRGVLIGGDTLFESAFVADANIRKACADEKLAIVQFIPSIDAIFNYHAPDFKGGEYLQNALDALAKQSGYTELAVAPWFPYGHSVSTMWACHISTWKPDRTFGFLSFKGGVDSSENSSNYASIPAMAIKAEFEEFGPAGPLRRELNEDRTTSWTVMRETLLKLRAADDNNLFCGLLEPGATHFRWADDAYGEYVAMFIRKCAQRRIPDWPIDAKEVKCLPIDPKSGALSSSEVFSKDHPAAAAYADFKGDPKSAFWHLDLELAKATDAFYAAHPLGKKPQFVTFADPKNGNLLKPGADLRLSFASEWTGPDTFKVAVAYTDKVPSFYPPVAEPIGHSDAPIKVYPYTGIFEQVGPFEFRPKVNGRKLKIEKDKDGKTMINVRADLIAVTAGDDTYRHAEQMGRSKGLASAKGKSQTITFEAPAAEIKADSPPIKLNATSDSKLPVRYYIESGPAEMNGNVLTLTDVPARGESFEIKVVAYQFGSEVEPKYSAADPVEHTITVRK